MTETLQTLDRRIRSAEELHSVTRTMRGLAAVSLRRDELAAEAINAYETVVEDGLHIALWALSGGPSGRALPGGALRDLAIERPPADAPTGLVVLGSNQGLCGPVNRRVATRARDEAERAVDLRHLAAVGPRLATELESAGLAPRLLGDLPATVDAIPDRAERVLAEVERWRRNGMTRLLVVFPHFLGRNRGHEPVTLQLLPTDRDWLEWLAIRRWPSRVLPTTTMDPGQLLADLLRQALFVRLLRSFVETMASISISRLAAMDGAQRNIEQRLSELRSDHHRLRHTEITKELLDVIAGYETIRGTDGGDGRGATAAQGR